MTQLKEALTKLLKKGFFTRQEVEKMDQWLFAPDGNPYFQYAPMSRIELMRWLAQRDGSNLPIGMSHGTDFTSGIIFSCIRDEPIDRAMSLGSRIHESVHGHLSGIEAYEIQRKDGKRLPVATAVGLMATEPERSLSPGAGTDYSTEKDSAASEGLIEYITQQLCRVKPSLLQEPHRSFAAQGPNALRDQSGPYQTWCNRIQKLRVKSEPVFQAMMDAFLTEASKNQPTAKRDSIAAMHQSADATLGMSDAIQHVLQAPIRAQGSEIAELPGSKSPSGLTDLFG